MFYYRPSQDRGEASFSWLKSKHSFSFGNYYDPQHMGISALRVINDDLVKPGAGFDTHGHRDMEIISYVLEGAIEHRDTLGNEFVVPAGEVQRMSAGSGIKHSEFNHSQTDNLRFLQIWVQPNQKNIQPSYEQKAIEQHSQLTPLVTADGRDGSLMMHQDASLFRLQLSAGETYTFNTENRPGYLHIINGKAMIDSKTWQEGDALGALGETFTVTASSDLTALWFDLPPLEQQ